MKHLGTVRLETERLILRRWRLQDAQDMYGNWASDTEVTKYLTFPPHKNVEESEQIIQSWMKMYQKFDFYIWAIEWKETGALIGNISGQPVDAVQEISIGYCLGKDWWNRGIMTEALLCVIQFFFEDCGMNRIEARHSVWNPASGQVMKKCNMIQEGILRQKDKSNAGISDLVYYSILKEDFNNKKESNAG